MTSERGQGTVYHMRILSNRLNSSAYVNVFDVGVDVDVDVFCDDCVVVATSLRDEVRVVALSSPSPSTVKARKRAYSPSKR